MKAYIITTGSLFGLLAVAHPFCVSGRCACYAQPLDGTHKGLLPNKRIWREVEDAMQRLHLGKGAA